MPPDLAGSSQMICCCLLNTHAWGQLAEKAIACTVMSHLKFRCENAGSVLRLRLFTTCEAVHNVAEAVHNV